MLSFFLMIFVCCWFNFKILGEGISFDSRDKCWLDKTNQENSTPLKVITLTKNIWKFGLKKCKGEVQGFPWKVSPLIQRKTHVLACHMWVEGLIYNCHPSVIRRTRVGKLNLQRKQKKEVEGPWALCDILNWPPLELPTLPHSLHKTTNFISSLGDINCNFIYVQLKTT